jgi:predicted AAA+ superfamily ATPase
MYFIAFSNILHTMSKMPHLRKRYAEDLLRNYLKFSPIVGLIGHRQVGKTTLVGGICSSYYTLDDEESLAYLVNSASEFLREIQMSGTVAIDEAQLMPKLFPALKEWVRKHKRPGQFLLSGSVRFTSQKSIRESLTGRIVNLELLPFSVSEMSNEPPSESAFRLHLVREFSENHASPSFKLSDWKSRMRQIEDFASSGGLPGICFVRDENLRSARLRSQLDTILDRDLRLIYPTRASLTELRLLVKSLAQAQGAPLRFSHIQRSIKATARTAQNLVHALESLFLIRTVPIEGDYRGVSVFFEDPAEALYSAGKKIPENSTRSHLCYLMIRSSFAYRQGVEPQFFQFRTRGGVIVPVAVRQGDHVSGWIPIQGSSPNRREIAAAKAFLAAYGNSKIFFINFEDQNAGVVDSRQLIIPIAEISI